MLKYFYDSANGLGNIIAPTPENLDEHLKNDMLYHASYENNSQEVFDLIFVGRTILRDILLLLLLVLRIVVRKSMKVNMRFDITCFRSISG